MRFLHRDAWPRWARAVTSPWLLSPLLVVALAVGGFTAYGAWTRAHPTHYARGGDAFGVDSLLPAPSASASGRRGKIGRNAKKPPAAATGKKKAAATASGRHATGSDSGRRSAGSGSTSGGSASGGSTSGGSTSPSGPSGPVLPAAGTYTLAVDGSENVKFGPYSACHNTFPNRSSLVISPASGEPAGSYDFDQRFFPDSAGKHDERHIYRYTDGGVFLSFEQATVTCAGVKQSTTVNYSPLQLRVPADVRVGQTWHNSGGDSGRTESGASRAVGTATLTVGGRSYRTFVIDTHLDLTGDEKGSRDQRWWWAPDLGVPLKWHESLSGSRSGATYSEDATFTVVGTP
jgi:hypothetical protein